MPEDIQNKTSEYIIYTKKSKNTSRGPKEQWIPGNRKETRSNQSRRSSQLYSTLYISFQQKEIQKTTRKKRIGQNQFDRRDTQKT